MASHTVTRICYTCPLEFETYEGDRFICTINCHRNRIQELCNSSYWQYRHSRLGKPAIVASPMEYEPATSRGPPDSEGRHPTIASTTLVTEVKNFVAQGRIFLPAPKSIFVAPSAISISTGRASHTRHTTTEKRYAITSTAHLP